MAEIGRVRQKLESTNEMLVNKMRGQIKSWQSLMTMADLYGAYRRELEWEKATMECLAKERARRGYIQL